MRVSVIEKTASTRGVPAVRAAWWPPLVTAAVVAAPALVALLVALHGIGDQPLWRDEVWSVEIAERPLGGVLEVIRNREANMSLYYVLLHGWMLLGDGDAHVRLLSAVPAAGAVLATALVAREWFGRLAAVVTGTLLATNLLFIGYAQEARAYTIAALLTTLSCWSFVRLVERRSRWDPLVYAVVTAAAVYSQLLAGLVVIAQLMSLAICNDRLPWRRILAATAGLTAAALPLALLVLSQRGGQTAWISPVTSRRPSRGCSPRSSEIHAYTPCSSRSSWRASPSRCDGRCRAVRTPGARARRHLGGDAGRAAVRRVARGADVRSALPDRRHPGPRPRAAAVAATVRRASTRRLVAAVVMVAAATVLLGSQQPQPKHEDLGSATAYVAVQAQPGDAIAYESRWARVGFAHHLEGKEVRLPDVAFAASPESQGDILAREAPAAVVERRMRAARRLWLVTYVSRRDLSGEVVHDLAPSVLRERRQLEVRAWGNVVLTLIRSAVTWRPHAAGDVEKGARTAGSRRRTPRTPSRR